MNNTMPDFFDLFFPQKTFYQLWEKAQKEIQEEADQKADLINKYEEPKYD